MCLKSHQNFQQLHLLFGVIVNDLNLAQKARHSVLSSLLGAVRDHRVLQDRSKSDTWLAVSWGYCLFFCWVESRTCKWWTWPFSWSDFQAKCGRCSLVPPSAYSEMQEERGCSDASRSWGFPAAPKAWKRPESSLPESLQRAWLCQNLEFELPELGDNKCLSFKLHSETANCSVISHSLGMHGLYSPWNSPGQTTAVGSCSLLKGSFQPRDRTQVCCIAGRFFTNWATREAQEYWRG